MSSTSQDQDEDEQIDWEEVDVDMLHLHSNSQESPEKLAFDIVLSKAGPHQPDKKRSANSAVEREIRHQVHRVHTITLLVAGLVRNRLLNDALLKARLLSLVPLSIINAFNHFSPETHPLARDRSRLFDSAMKDLISWWWQSFQVDNSFQAMISRSWSDAEALYNIAGNGGGTSKLTDKTQQDQFVQLLESGEPIHGVKSLMKRALLMKGSRDMSAQLFTSCLRALNIPARLVFSLQPVTWRGAGAGGKPANPSTQMQRGVIGSGAHSKVVRNSNKPQSVAEVKSKLKPKQTVWTAKAVKATKAIKAKSFRVDNQIQVSSEVDQGVQVRSSDPLSCTVNYAETSKQGSSRQAPVKLRQSKSSKSKNWTKSPSPEPYEMNKPPVFWTEVYSRPLREWYCVDVTRKRMRCKTIMEPSKNNSENKLIYAIAYEEDHFIRDVTARYTHSFGATTMKARLPSKKNETGWFDLAVALLKRPYKLGRDIDEDIEIEKAQVTEAMPTTIIGFKNHPKYVLERHLKREEVIHPKKSIGTFRGDNVYPRSSVVICKTAENYMREGKRIKGGETPLKMVKPRTVTINRKRETELLKMDGLEIPLQGLFAEWQTELLIPPPIVNGIIPRNAYGNFDLFAPHMLPKGAKHLPYKGIAKIAKKLQVSYADAVVSFEFHKSRATPVIDGIIVPDLEAEFVLDAYWSSEEAHEDKEHRKMEERCLKRWKKFIIGLRIRHRLQEEYQNELLRSLNSQKPVEGISQLTHADPDQPNSLTEQKQTVCSVLDLHPGEVPFELDTDHQMNPMRMTRLEEVETRFEIPRHNEEIDLKESSMVLVPSNSTEKIAESFTPSSLSSPNRSGKTESLITGSNSKGLKRKSPPFEVMGHILTDSNQVDKIVDVLAKQLHTSKHAVNGVGEDSVNSSPLTSPPPSPEMNEFDSGIVISPPKRIRIDSLKKKSTPKKQSFKISKDKNLDHSDFDSKNKLESKLVRRKSSPIVQVENNNNNVKKSRSKIIAPVVKRNLRPRKK